MSLFFASLTAAHVSVHLPLQFRGGLPDGPEYPEISRAPAQIAAHVRDDLFVACTRVLIQQRFGRQNHPRRAEAALESELIEKSLLQRVQAAGAIRESFDCGDALIAGFIRKVSACADWEIVDEHGTSAANLSLAGELHSREPAARPQNLCKRLSRFDLQGLRFAIQLECYLHR
jgi:hypothetical protein